MNSGSFLYRRSSLSLSLSSAFLVRVCTLGVPSVGVSGLCVPSSSDLPCSLTLVVFACAIVVQSSLSRLLFQFFKSPHAVITKAFSGFRESVHYVDALYDDVEGVNEDKDGDGDGDGDRDELR